MPFKLFLPAEINGLYIFKQKQLSISIKQKEVFATVSIVYKKSILIEKSTTENIINANESFFDNISATLARIKAWAGNVDIVACSLQPELTIYMQSEFPFKKRDAIELVLKNEIVKTLPLKQENIVADFLIESEKDSGCKTISAITQKENVLDLIAVFKSVNISVDKITPEALSIYEYIKFNKLISDSGIIIDIEQNSTTIFVVENWTIKSIRTINKGLEHSGLSLKNLIADIVFTIQSVATSSDEYVINLMPCKELDKVKELIESATQSQVHVIEAPYDIYSQAIAYSAVTMADFNLIPEEYNYNKNLLTIKRFFASGIIIILILTTLFLNNLIKLYRAESILKNNKNELQKNIAKNFKVKNIKNSPNALVKEIKKSLDSEISIWMPYSDKNRTKYSKALEELSKILNPKELNMDTEEVVMNDNFITIKASAENFEVLTKFEDLVEKSNVFKMQSRPQTTKFEVKLIYSLDGE